LLNEKLCLLPSCFVRMNDDDLAAAFAQRGLAFRPTTLSSQRQIGPRVRDFIENGMLRISQEGLKVKGRAKFSSKHEIIPTTWSSAPVPISEDRTLGKLNLLSKPSKNFQLTTVVDTVPTEKEYQEQAINRPKRRRITIKSSEIQDKQALIAESEARVVVIPEALISSEVFNRPDDDEEDSEGSGLDPVKIPRQRESPSIYGNLKDYEKWSNLAEQLPLADAAFYRMQTNKGRLRNSRALAPDARYMERVVSSEYYQNWFSYFQSSLAVWLSRTWNIDYFSAKRETITNKFEKENWLLYEVTPKIRAKVQSFYANTSNTVVQWALAYDSIEFRELSKVKTLVRFSDPTDPKYRPVVLLKLPKLACLQLDMLQLCLHPEIYFHRRTYQYFYNTCVTNAINDLGTYLKVMTNESKAAAQVEDIDKEFKIWWALIAACGGDYLTAEMNAENKNLVKKEKIQGLEYAEVRTGGQKILKF